ncbi:hypothetical protein N1236_00685 [Acetivibrio thermocellus]|uniref:hypothetical protein n=1 Tax=Acetivibrio thermocellus TaxID=1515 RepID=UPI0021AD8B31|nr:hypothetical protein [Acetivibrio thermocellus]UWV47067.1 hypothetical protein N1236_00685 [Acetivibrio thermocellus]
MKKAIAIIILTCLFLLLGTLVFVKYKENASIKLVEKTIQEAQEINANSFMGMEYLEFAGLSEERAKYFNDDMPGSKVTDDGYVRGYYFKIPKDASDRRLTQININGGDYHVFGIRLGDSVEQAAEKLKQRGYKRIKSMEDIYREGIHRTRFQKELVIIDLQTEMNSQIIKGISVLTDYP